MSEIRESRGDNVVNPAHHQGHRVIEMIESSIGRDGAKAFGVGNAIKYLARHQAKGGDDDILKALWYLVHAMAGCPLMADNVVSAVRGDMAKKSPR